MKQCPKCLQMNAIPEGETVILNGKISKKYTLNEFRCWYCGKLIIGDIKNDDSNKRDK